MNFHPRTVQSTLSTPLGPMLACASPSGLSGLWFSGQKHHPEGKIAHLSEDPLNLMLQKTQLWLDAYFAGTKHETPALDLSGGTAFQQRIWQALLGIAHGHTAGYGDMAARVSSPKAARAVGAAVGKNPISIIVPCHRVIGASGALTGYAGGLDRKVWLLRHEGVLL